MSTATYTKCTSPKKYTIPLLPSMPSMESEFKPVIVDLGHDWQGKPSSLSDMFKPYPITLQPAEDPQTTTSPSERPLLSRIFSGSSWSGHKPSGPRHTAVSLSLPPDLISKGSRPNPGDVLFYTSDLIHHIQPRRYLGTAENTDNDIVECTPFARLLVFPEDSSLITSTDGLSITVQEDAIRKRFREILETDQTEFKIHDVQWTADDRGWDVKIDLEEERHGKETKEDTDVVFRIKSSDGGKLCLATTKLQIGFRAMVPDDVQASLQKLYDETENNGGLVDRAIQGPGRSSGMRAQRRNLWDQNFIDAQSVPRQTRQI